LAKVEMIRMTPERILCKDSSGNTTFDTNDLFLRQFSGGELVVGGTNIGTPIFYGLTNLGPFNIGGGYMSETFGGENTSVGINAFSDWNFITSPGMVSTGYTKEYHVNLPAGEVKLISWYDINPQGDSSPQSGYLVGGNSWFQHKYLNTSIGYIPKPPGQQQWVSPTQYIYASNVEGNYISYRWRFWRDSTLFINAYYIRLEPINATCTLTAPSTFYIDSFDFTDAGLPYDLQGLTDWGGWFGKFNLSFLVSKPPINLTAEVTV